MIIPGAPRGAAHRLTDQGGGEHLDPTPPRCSSQAHCRGWLTDQGVGTWTRPILGAATPPAARPLQTYDEPLAMSQQNHASSFSSSDRKKEEDNEEGGNQGCSYQAHCGVGLTGSQIKAWGEHPTHATPPAARPLQTYDEPLAMSHQNHSSSFSSSDRKKEEGNEEGGNQG